MVNQIHDFEMNSVGGYMLSHKEARLEGYETDFAKFMSLFEMFKRAGDNVIFKPRPSGSAMVQDLTSDQRNIRLCSFDTTELATGWSALKSIHYRPEKAKLNYYPYRISMYYIGTLSGNQTWYNVSNLIVETNDWGL